MTLQVKTALVTRLPNICLQVRKSEWVLPQECHWARHRRDRSSNSTTEEEWRRFKDSKFDSFLIEFKTWEKKNRHRWDSGEFSSRSLICKQTGNWVPQHRGKIHLRHQHHHHRHHRQRAEQPSCPTVSVSYLSYLPSVSLMVIHWGPGIKHTAINTSDHWSVWSIRHQQLGHTLMTSSAQDYGDPWLQKL